MSTDSSSSPPPTQPRTAATGEQGGGGGDQKKPRRNSLSRLSSIRRNSLNSGDDLSVLSGDDRLNGALDDEAREVRGLARKETFKVQILRLIVAICIVGAGTVISIFTYRVLKEEEEQDSQASVRVNNVEQAMSAENSITNSLKNQRCYLLAYYSLISCRLLLKAPSRDNLPIWPKPPERAPVWSHKKVGATNMIGPWLPLARLNYTQPKHVNVLV